MEANPHEYRVLLELLECLNERHYVHSLGSCLSSFLLYRGPFPFAATLYLLFLLLFIATGLFSKQITPLYVFLYLEYRKRKQDPEVS